jgi:hypothetical protein
VRKSSAPPFLARGRAGHAAAARTCVGMVGVRGVHAVTTSTSCRHVVNDEVARVEHRFGLAMCQVWT